ncbi:protein ENHANCED DISEASE RESISTANCE 2-like isoform X2 [Salvia miltiorrhiza]|uniref:protein ENHANCED DISEASE RESISTANCE 2-like isoform X2 n=1 Tax=Salvia miltiorrhiza TaxID=226208 RepID=UPI0025AC2839|nr:protein ENHANCED DISEASE RESISTANCE 2-like isoform X2 [Salvia miltiorrhiza]
MGMAENEGKMQGWLHLIRYNRIGLQYSRKRYFILEDDCLKSFKSIPTSHTEEPVRSAIIDSCIRVVDNGRESHRRKLFFIFTLYNTANHNDQLKLGATSSEEAARWIRALQDAAVKTVDLVSCSKRKYQPFSLSISKRMARRSIDWTSTSLFHVDAMTSDVIAPSPWKIFGCQNGLRLFKEAKDIDSNVRRWDDHPAIMAIGVINGTPEAVFRTLMAIDASRTEWDFCFNKGSVVEHLDGHTDIIHIQLYKHCLPWAMKRRDLLLRRYWRREDDGTYVILYHSVVHKKCQRQNGYVRASVKSGGYVIIPMNRGKQSIIKHMLSVDWRCWKSYLRKAYARSITICMLGTVAALRELFKAKEECTIDVGVPESEEVIKTEVCCKRIQNETDEATPVYISGASSITGLNDIADEFFDVPEPSDDEEGWPSNTDPDSCYVNSCQTKFSSTANFVKRLQDLTVQKKGYVDLQSVSWEDNYYGTTLPKDANFNTPCSWAEADPTSFLVRGKTYLHDQKKIKANGTLMQMVGADWITSSKREDDLAGRSGGIVTKYAVEGRSEFFFVINIQVPGTTTCSLALYYMLKTPLKETPLLERFIDGDDAFRDSRFKLIPYISKGSWIVKQSVGRKACLVGQALQMNYFRGKNYLELGIDIGSSTVARGVVGLVLGYLNNLVIEMAFLIQGNSPEELPEILVGTCRLNHLDAAKAVSSDTISSSRS